MLAKPSLKGFEPKLSGLVQAGQERVGLAIVEIQLIAVHLQEGSRHSRGNAFVAVQEWMILRQALPECGGFLDYVGIVATLRSGQCGVESTMIPNARRASEPRDQHRMSLITSSIVG